MNVSLQSNILHISIENILYSLRPQKNEILEYYHVLVYQVWPLIDKKV
jgi:hypothetical protein